MQRETEEWWQQAQADLTAAEVLATAGLHFAVSIFAQQAAERALKAMYLERQVGAEPPRVHDLEFLGSLLAAPSSLDPDFDALADLITLARYPDIGRGAPVNTIGQADAESHLEAARRIVTWISTQL